MRFVPHPRDDDYDDHNGLHCHQCNKCHAVWQHPTPTEPVVGYHNCPKCGKEQRWKMALSLVDIIDYPWVEEERKMKVEKYALHTKEGRMTAESVMQKLHDLAKEYSAVDKEGDVFKDSIEELIKMERARGMPTRYDRHNGLVFFKITVEEVE